MTRYRIVCTNQEPGSESHDQAHIVQAGVGSTNGSPDNIYSVEKVRSMIDNGDEFYTKYAGVEADVHKYSDAGESYRSVAKDVPNLSRTSLARIHKNEERRRWYLDIKADDERVVDALRTVEPIDDTLTR